jgi:hypothetical protein
MVKGKKACIRLAPEPRLVRAGRGPGRAGGRRAAAGRRPQRAHGRAQQQLLLLRQPADGEHRRRALARACAPAPPAARHARGPLRLPLQATATSQPNPTLMFLRDLYQLYSQLQA